MNDRFDPVLYELIPHRPPMLLINHVVELGAQGAMATVIIDELSPFFVEGKGVPTWVGLEYMGQTAALIAGHQLKEGLIEPHLGFLLGTRMFKAEAHYFAANTTLLVSCKEKVLAGDNLATFECRIDLHVHHKTQSVPLAQANLSVFRRPLGEKSPS